MNYDFTKDLESGIQVEQEAIEVLKKNYQGVEIIGNLNKDKYYDIKCRHMGVTTTVEVKWDKMAEETLNVAVEYQSWGKQSGISTTESDYLIYKIGDKFYLIKTRILREMIKRNMYNRTVIGGDKGSNTKMYLFDINTFIKNTKRL